MKKMKRLLVAMLSCLTAFACVAGMSACKKDEKTGDSSVQAPASSVESVVEEVSSEEVSSEEVSSEEVSSEEVSSEEVSSEEVSSEEVSSEEPASEEPAVCEHEWAADAENSKDATCLEAGVAADVCVLCGETKSEEVAALGHSIVAVDAVAATCTEAGKEAGEYCEACDYAVEGAEIAALGHSYEVTEEVAATCDAEGKKVEVCANCGDVIETIIDALGHNWVVDEENSVAAGCIVDGLTVENCDVCGAHQETVAPQFGHSFDLSVEGEQVKAPTCTEVGEIRWYCAHYEDCGGYQGEDIPMAAHTWVETAEVPATCTEAGVTAYNQCSVCEAYANKPEVIPALGHDLVEAELKAPTCTEPGLTSYSKCTRCDYEEGGEEIAPTGHIGEADCLAPAKCTVCGESFGSKLGHSYVLHEQIIASCTTWGTDRAYYDCSRCGELLLDEKGGNHVAFNWVKPSQHQYNAGDATCEEGARCRVCKLVVTTVAPHEYNVIEAKDPTCETFGWEEYRVCKYCDYVNDDYVEIPATGHEWDIEVYGSLPTCTTKGSVYRGTCLNCKVVLNKNIEIEKLPHVAVNEATCTEAALCACGAVVEKALGHTTVKVKAQTPTCEVIGWKEYSFCIVCNETFNYEELAALGHKATGKVAAKAPKCTTAGNDEYYKCTNANCEYKGNVLVPVEKFTNDNEVLAVLVIGEVEYNVVENATLPALGHDLDTSADNYKEGQEPTCTEPGFTAEGTCLTCGVTVKSVTVYANGHTAKNAANNYHDTKFLNEDSMKATCTSPAYCGACGEYYGKVHSATKWVGAVAATSATCTEDGNYRYNTCADCGQVWINKNGKADCVAEWMTVDTGKVDKNGDPIYEEVRNYDTAYTLEDTIIPVVEHRYVLEMAGKDATCTEDGWEAYIVCQLCGKLESDIVVIDALGHKSELEGTCREKLTCEVCLKVYDNPNVTEDHHFDVKGHEGECVICGICEAHKYEKDGAVKTYYPGDAEYAEYTKDDKYTDQHYANGTPIIVKTCDVCGHQTVDHK